MKSYTSKYMNILTLSEQIYYKYVYIYDEKMKTLAWYKCFPYNASRRRNVRVIHFLNLLRLPSKCIQPLSVLKF